MSDKKTTSQLTIEPGSISPVIIETTGDQIIVRPYIKPKRARIEYTPFFGVPYLKIDDTNTEGEK